MKPREHASPIRYVRLGLGLAVISGSVVASDAFAGTHTNSDGPALPPAAVATAQLLSTAFQHAAQVVAPSVVHITAEQPARPIRNSMRAQPFGDRGLDRFHDQDQRGPRFRGAPQMPGDMQPGGTSQGTGVIVRHDGYIVTNNHVVSGAATITVRLADDREYEGELVGTDPDSDLAVILIDVEGLDHIEFGDSRGVKVGEWVIAVGGPFGLDQSVTAGIVSATGRSGIGLSTYENFIQTDAAVNPGNSGGPLVDLYGNLLGINTAISSRGGANDGIGFAIPSHMVRRVMDGIIEDGHVSRGWLGVGIQAMSRELAESYGLDETDGVIVTDVIEDGPAEEAGLEPGDVVFEFEGREIETLQNLLNVVAETAPGHEVDVEVFRDGDREVFEVTLAERPAREKDAGRRDVASSPERLGFQVQARSLKEPDPLGVDLAVNIVVTGVAPGSPAAKAGLRRGDIILDVGSTSLGSTNDLWSALDESDLKRGARLRVQRGDRKHFLVLQDAK